MKLDGLRRRLPQREIPAAIRALRDEKAAALRSLRDRRTDARRAESRERAAGQGKRPQPPPKPT